MKTTKVCYRCNIEKPLDRYYKKVSNADLKDNYCIECRNRNRGVKVNGLLTYEGNEADVENAIEILEGLGYDLSDMENNPVYRQFNERMRQKYGVIFKD